MQVIYLHNAFPSIKLSQYLNQFTELDRDELTGDTRVIIRSESLTANEQAVMTDFCTALKINPSNYGLAVFDGFNALTAYYGGRIGLDKEKKLVLVFGASDNNTGDESAVVPLTFKKYTDASPDDVEQGTYYIGKVKCSLTLQSSPLNPDELKLYVTFKTKSNIFNIMFKMDKDKTAQEVEEAWNNGRFDEVCLPLMSTPIVGNKFLSSCFKDGTFPKEGVAFYLTNGRLSIKESEGKKDLISSIWRVEMVNHPELMVKGGLKVEELIDMPLKEAGNIFLGESCQATKALIQNPTLKTGFLYFYGVNMQGNNPQFNWIPLHCFMSDFAPNLLPPAVKSRISGFIGEVSRAVAKLNPAAPEPSARPDFMNKPASDIEPDGMPF